MRAIVNPALNKYKGRTGQQLATCGFFVNMVFLESGYEITCINRNDRGRAFAYLKCPHKKRIGRTVTVQTVKQLRPGMIVVYDFSHVGIITGVYPTYVTTIESNTSTIGSVHRYSFKRGGIYEKVRRYSSIAYVTDCANCATAVPNQKILDLKKIYQPFKNQ
jgi:hypothetical protein